MFRRGWGLAALVVIGLLLVGSRRLTASPPDTDDRTITSDIQARLFEDPVLKTRDIRVSTQQGIVTLAGSVNTELERAAVERIASTEEGVQKVIDSLSLSGTAPVTEVQDYAAGQPAAEVVYPNAGVPADQPVPSTLTLPAGALITVRTTEPLSSDHNQPGDGFTAVLEQPLVADGWVVSRRGQTALGRVAVAQKAGRVTGVSQLGVELSQLVLVDGHQLPVRSQLLQTSAGTSRGRDAAAIGTTTGLGAAIGAAAEGGKGAGIGAAAGAAAGIAGVLLTRGRPTVVPPETLLTFRLESPLTISTQRSQQAFRPVTRDDYEADRLRNRPQHFATEAYPPPPPPPAYYWGYYPWGYSPWSYYGWGYPAPLYFGFYGFGPRFGRFERRGFRR
jgi:hypothetical protein